MRKPYEKVWRSAPASAKIFNELFTRTLSLINALHMQRLLRILVPGVLICGSLVFSQQAVAQSPVAFVNATTFSSGTTNVSSFPVRVPAGILSGDLLLMSMYHGANSDPTVTPPAGWTRL